jgi:CelD/BcsL family acetyltransferase involved in cellulose biosynthesis
VTAALADRVDVEDRLGPVAEEWDGLADRTGAPAPLRPGWVGAWWRAFGRNGGGGRLQIVTVRRSGRLAALVALHRPALRAPAFVTEPMPLSARPGTLRATANWYTPRFGALAQDDDAAAALVGAVLGRRPPLVSLAFLDPDDSGTRIWRDGLAAAGYRMLEVPLPPSPWIAVEGDWAGFEAGLGAKLRGDLRRRRRRLEEEGPVEVAVETGDGRVDELVQEGFGVEPSGWKAAQGSAVVSRSETVQFYSEVARWAAARGILRLAFLRVSGRPVAFQFGLEEAGVYSFLKGGHDPTFERFAPGKLLVRAMVERAHDLGLRRFDFLGGAEAWKLEWTDRCRARSVLHACAPGARGGLESLVLAYGRPARGALRARLKAWRR